MSFELNIKKRQREVLLEAAGSLSEADRAKLQRLNDFEQAAGKLVALDPSMQDVLRERGDALSRGITGVAVRAATATVLQPNPSALGRFAKASLPASMRLIGSTKEATYCIAWTLDSDVKSGNLKIPSLDIRETDVSSGEVTIRQAVGFDIIDRTDLETLFTKVVLSLQLASSTWTIVPWAAMQWLPPGEPGVTLASS